MELQSQVPLMCMAVCVGVGIHGNGYRGTYYNKQFLIPLASSASEDLDVEESTRYGTNFCVARQEGNLEIL